MIERTFKENKDILLKYQNLISLLDDSLNFIPNFLNFKIDDTLFINNPAFYSYAVLIIRRKSTSDYFKDEPVWDTFILNSKGEKFLEFTGFFDIGALLISLIEKIQDQIKLYKEYEHTNL